MKAYMPVFPKTGRCEFMPFLDVLFRPKSVAVIGASRTPGKIGYAILESVKMSFSGKIYPINPEAADIMGLTAYTSVLKVEEPIDLAVIAVKAEKVKEVILECKKKKIKAAIIISSGFSEIGNKEGELELKKAGKDIRILGPNCLGVFAPKEMDTLFMPHERLKRPKEGGIGFISQSGAFGSALIDLAASEGIGISKFVSIGNKIDINETEMIDYLGKDPSTRAIAVYLESITDGKAFVNVAKKVSKRKPIVAIKAGKTKAGTEAVASHTGSLAGEAEIYAAAFEQAGIIEAKTSEEVFDFSKALANQPALKDNKIAIVTDGGGFGILAADTAENCGLELVQLDDKSLTGLRQFLPIYASLKNPIDLTGDSTSERYRKALDIVFKDKNVSGVVVIALLQIATLDEKITDILRNCKLYGKPFVVCATGGEYTQKKALILESFGIPVYPTPERAVKAMCALRDYGKIAEAGKPAPKPEEKKPEKKPAKKKPAKAGKKRRK